jgi:hypothetical protein
MAAPSCAGRVCVRTTFMGDPAAGAPTDSAGSAWLEEADVRCVRERDADQSSTYPQSGPFDHFPTVLLPRPLASMSRSSVQFLVTT